MRLDELWLTEARVRDARRFGIWLGHLYSDRHGGADADGIHLYDYNDDKHGYALRYRLMVDKEFLGFVRQVMPEINARGWHLTVEMRRSRNRWQLVFEPTLTSRIPRDAIFWHVAPRSSIPAILSTGLQPQMSRHGFAYPQPRVYLFRDRRDRGRMAEVLAQHDTQPIDYGLVRVNMRRAKGIRLHIDPELPQVGVYTTQPIPPAAISVPA